MDLKDIILTNFGNEFWTDREEMINSIECTEEAELAVVRDDGEYIAIANYDTDEEVIAYIGDTGRTMWIQGVK